MAAVTARAVNDGEGQMRRSDAAFNRGDLLESMLHARGAAVMYAPGAPHVARAYARWSPSRWERRRRGNVAPRKLPGGVCARSCARDPTRLAAPSGRVGPRQRQPRAPGSSERGIRTTKEIRSKHSIALGKSFSVTMSPAHPGHCSGRGLLRYPDRLGHRRDPRCHAQGRALARAREARHRDDRVGGRLLDGGGVEGLTVTRSGEDPFGHSISGLRCPPRGGAPRIDHTVAAYRRDLEQLAGYLRERSSGGARVQDVDKLVLRGWLGELSRLISPTSIARKLAAVRTFFRYLEREGVVRSNPAGAMASPKVRRKLPTFPRWRRRRQRDASAQRVDATERRRTTTGCPAVGAPLRLGTAGQ